VCAVAAAQILLIAMDPGERRERLGRCCSRYACSPWLLLCAAAWRITHQPQPVPADHAGWNDIWVDAVLTAVALGGPFDGASWQLSLDQLPAPQQVWLPASGGGHRYRLDAAPAHQRADSFSDRDLHPPHSCCAQERRCR